MVSFVKPLLVAATITPLLALPMLCTAATVIETLVVTGEASPEQASQLNGEDLMPGARNDAAEYLLGLPGVQADSRSNYAQDTRITLRGFGARSAFGVRGVRLELDGIPLTMADGQGQFSGAILDGVNQIQVLTGPVAALYGNGAGGVISLKSAAPTTRNIAVAGTMDEAGLARQQLIGEWQQGDASLRAQTSRLQASGDRPHASAERNQWAVQGYYQLDNGIEAQLRVDKEDAPLLEDPLGLSLQQWQADPHALNSSADFFNTRKTIQHRQASLSVRKAEGDQRWQLAAWGGDRAIEQYLAFKGDAITSSGGVINLDRDFRGANGNYTWDTAIANQPINFTLGAEWSAMADRRLGFINNAGSSNHANPSDIRRNEQGQVTSRDAYAIGQWHVTPAWHWLLGARHSDIGFDVDDYFVVLGNNDDSGSRGFNYVSRALETRYQLDAHWALQASTGRGFETPTLTEAAHTAGDTGFNRALDASFNRQYELSVEYQRQAVTVMLTAFNITTSNEIVVEQSQNGRTSYRNAAATERTGAELASQWRWSPYWNGRFTANYLSAEYSEGEWQGNRLPGVARVNQYLQLAWQPFASDKLQVALGVVQRSRVATDDNNLLHAPAYHSIDLALSGAMDFGAQTSSLRSEWWLKLANISNEQYVGSVIVNQTNGRAFEPAAGRNLAGGVTLRW